jgi:hypothetical protein
LIASDISPSQNSGAKSGLKNGRHRKQKKIELATEALKTRGVFSLFVQFYSNIDHFR